MKLTIQTLQKLCLQARIHFGTEALIIAGGAPRDVLSGVPVKDIDIFVQLDERDGGQDTAFTRGCASLAAAIGGTPEFRPAAEEYADILDLCDITSPGVHGVVQVIGIDEHPVDDVPHYDFGLSQVFVSPTGMFFTEAAIRDRAHKTITHVPTYHDEHGFQRSKARCERLRAKYSGWTFVNCESLDADFMPQQPAPASAPVPAEIEV